MSELQTDGDKLKTVRPLRPQLTLSLTHCPVGFRNGQMVELLPLWAYKGRFFESRFETWIGAKKIGSQFVQTILARYLSRPGYWPRLGLIFKTDPPGQAIQTHQTWVNLAPRLSLKLALRPYRPGQPLDRTSTPPAPRPVYPFDRTSTPPAPRLVYLLPVTRRPAPAPTGEKLTRRLRTREVIEIASVRRRLIHHLISQGRRLEAATTPGQVRQTAPAIPAVLPGKPGLPETVPLIRPAPRAVQRSPQIQTETGSPVVSGNRQPLRGTFSPSLAGDDRAATQPPAINVNQLAEQVMQTIDRRLLAYRERTGRI